MWFSRPVSALGCTCNIATCKFITCLCRYCVIVQAQELSQAEAQDGGLSDLLGRASEASSVLGDGGLQADVDFDRLAAAGQWPLMPGYWQGRQNCNFLC